MRLEIHEELLPTVSIYQLSIEAVIFIHQRRGRVLSVQRGFLLVVLGVGGEIGNIAAYAAADNFNAAFPETTRE